MNNNYLDEYVKSFCEYGYANIEISDILILIFSNALEISKNIHNSTYEQKKTIFCGLENGIYGYAPSSRELDLYELIIPKNHTCKKRKYSSFDFGFCKEIDSKENQILYSKNLWPNWLRNNISADCMKIHEIINDLLKSFLFKVFDHISILYEKDFFDFSPGTTRFMKYPSSVSSEIGIPLHTDYEFLSMSYSKTPGLQIISQNEKKSEINSSENIITIQAGDCLEKVTDGHIKATSHQVLLSFERHSIVHFLCSKPNVYLKTGKLFYSNSFTEKSFCPSDHLLKMNISNNYHLEMYIKKKNLCISLPKDRINPFRRPS